MQREREGRKDLLDMMPGLFGGRDPFDDPFFTRPFGVMSEPGKFNQITSSGNKAQNSKSKGLVIEELNTDHEGEKEDKVPGDGEMHSGSSKEPSVEHPDDDVDDWKNEDLNYKNQHSNVGGTQPKAHNFRFQTCKVTYGGVDGAYYTSTRTRTGNDGVLLEESKEADKTSGQATHRISRGIHDKGHSFTRKLNSDGKVDTLQTLHNLNEDELVGFEEAWKGNANKHLPGWNDGFGLRHNAGFSGDEQRGMAASKGAWVLPSSEPTQNSIVRDNEPGTSASGGRTKKVVRINID